MQNDRREKKINYFYVIHEIFMDSKNKTDKFV